MSTSIKVELVSSGFKEILTGDGVKSLVQDATDGIAARAGDGFESSVFLGNYGGGRWVGCAIAASSSAEESEACDKTLSKAVT